MDICITTPPPPSNNNQADCLITTINYDFELPQIPGGVVFINHNEVQGWRTTASDQTMEFWGPSNPLNVAAYSGTQFIELNANVVSAIYQDYQTPQPTVFNYGFAHRGRQGTDTCQLLAGPPTGPFLPVGSPVSTGNSSWSYNTGTYEVPAGQTITRFIFQSISSVGGASLGNFLDAISFTANNGILSPNPFNLDCGDISANLEAAGIGTWSAHVDNPSPVTISDPSANNVEISGFTLQGSYYFDWTTQYCTSTIEVTYTGAEPDSPAVTNVTYCQGQDAVPLEATFEPENTQTWYFNGDMYSTPPTPATTTLGNVTYYVSQTAPNGCESITVPLVVTVTTAGASVTGFTLPAAVCAGAPNVLPTLATGFTNGGTFSSTPGLDIDEVTGEIDLTASTPGVYTVTYSIPADAGNCLSPGSSSVDITINAAPQLVEPDGLETCDDNFDGLAVFNLTTAGNQAVNGLTGLTVTYHESLADAQTGDNDIDIPAAYLSEVANNQVIYVRAIQAGTTTNCYSVEEVQLAVHPRPAVPVIADYVLCDDPATTGNVTTFDLTAKSDEATGGVAGVTVTYYNSQADAQSGTDAIDNEDSFANTTSPQTVWVRLENGFGCITVSSFNLVVNPLPAVNANLEPFRECEDENGLGTFNLNTIAPEVVNGAAGYTVTFYETQAEAEEGDEVADALPVSYTSASATIYARVVNNATLCNTTVPVVLEGVAAPELVAATPLEQCDDNNDGFADFNLTIAGNEVINGQTGLLVTYHETQDDALFGENDLDANEITAYNSISQIIYIRVVQQGTTDECASIAEVQLIVHDRPEIPSLEDYILCDDNNSPDGVEDFDLTTYNDEATDDVNATVSWYGTEGDAIAAVNPVADATVYPSGTGEVWVRVENEFGCYDVAPLQLIVNPLPLVAQNLEPFYACEEIPGQGAFDFDEIAPAVTQGAAGYSVAFYYSVDGAAGGGDDYLTSPYLSPNATIYARVEDVVTGCSIIAPVTLEVLPAPIAPQPVALQECDPNTDGFAIFDLTGTIAGIESALGGTVTVKVHETADDAFFGTNPIPNVGAYENINEDLQVLHLRVESSQTACFDTVTLTLIVNPAPEAVTPADAYELCDNGTSDTDGVAIFNLTDYAEEVLGGLDPAQFSVSYHESAGAAALGFPAIPAPASYPGQSGTVYIRVTNDETGCYDVVELELIVNPLPSANQPEPYSLCDGPEGDEIEEFDLTTTIPFITGGFNGVTVTFYQEYADAVGQVNAITTPEAYSNDTSPGVETIFVRVTDNETGCYRIVLQDIRVEPLPVLVMPAPEDATGCDTDGDGVATFNLDDLVEDMINNGVDITVAFYETDQDALNGLNAIPNTGSYDNINPFVQTLYVVATNEETGCQSTPYALMLYVDQAPQAPELEDITQCDDQDQYGQDNFAFFDLTVYEGYIYEEIEAEPGTLTIHYFADEDYANAGAPRITTPAHYNGQHNQTIWVRVENTATGCYSLTSFQLFLNQPWALNTPTMLVQCNEELPNDMQTTFDLTVKEAEILGPMGIGVGNVVTYYTSQGDAETGTDPIEPPTAFENEVNPQTLFVKVTTPDGCVSYTTLTVKVLPLPTPNTAPDALELCDDNATGDGVESFDLTQAEEDIADNDFTVTFTYYPTEADATAEPPTNEITAPENYVSGTGSVWVRVNANTNNPNDPVCYQVVELPLIVHPLPAQGSIAPYAICEQNTDGFALFDFNTHMDEILGPDVDPADYDDYDVDFSYNGTPVPYIYTNVVQGNQTIDVHVVYEPTGCETTVQLQLLVEEQAIAYDVTTPDFDLCDTDGTNDGTMTIDLTQADADIIGVQNPAIHAVSYYESEADALASTNAIANPAAYPATTQTIWARIVNTSTVSGCPDFTSFEVVIELLPEPEITTDGDNHTICVDFATGDVIRPLLLESGVVPNGHVYDWYLDGVLVESNQNGTYLAVAPGTYTVEVTGPAPNNCVSDMSQGFEVLQSGPPSAIGDGFVVSNAFGEDQTITVLVEGYGEYQYSLYPEGPWQNSNVFTNVAPGEHLVYIRDISTADPCTDYGYHLDAVVSVINYPHYFTPNGDGYNDTWNIIGLQAEGYQAIIYIFDRYGKLMKQISPDGEGWDGTYNGNPVPADDYWFTVEFNEGLHRRTFKAHFALKR
jgi:large repetitive protein